MAEKIVRPILTYADEAHHAVAPVLKRVIQYFNSDFTIGLTATDQRKKIRFLCACNMISEGWDYPELGILVMARPTLSKVLYLQQIGRGLRKTAVKTDWTEGCK